MKSLYLHRSYLEMFVMYFACRNKILSFFISICCRTIQSIYASGFKNIKLDARRQKLSLKPLFIQRAAEGLFPFFLPRWTIRFQEKRGRGTARFLQ